MSLSIGIVGLPNSGKSTLFSALTGKVIESANYPYATVEPDSGIVPVPDARLEALAAIVDPKKIVPATVEFIDIAGLARGANEGSGLGNQFLAAIRETDALIEVVRYFEDENVVHVDGTIDPIRDAETLRLELVFADMDTVTRALERLEREAKKDKTIGPKLATIKRIAAHLEQGNRASTMEMTDEERSHIYDLHLLTAKPMLYVANIGEDQTATGLEPLEGSVPTAVYARVESDLAELERDEAAEYLSELGLEMPSLDVLIQEAYRLLGLESYFTAGEMEVRAWTIPIGAKAPQAAGVIHTDFERGFIKAEVISYDDFIELGGEKGAREVGKMRLEGKEYVVKDGDVVHFRFNV
jgi:GTP-binding protein YchF